MVKWICFLAFLGWSSGGFSQVGPFAPQAGEAGSTAIHKDSNIIVGWAVDCLVQKGFENIAHPIMVASSGNAANATGVADGFTTSLGDSGIATYSFNTPLSNHEGYDFAVFENGFSTPQGDFLELAKVEISSNGIDFYPFPSTSLTPTQTQIGAFQVLDPTYIHGLAGKYSAGYGTPFDFSELDSIAELDLMSISYIRVVDAVGSINNVHSTFDRLGNAINDPWPTEFASSGFDLDALAVINASAVGMEEIEALNFRCYPNPVADFLTVETKYPADLKVFSIQQSSPVLSQKVFSKVVIDAGNWTPGVYSVQLTSDAGIVTKKVIVL